MADVHDKHQSIMENKLILQLNYEIDKEKKKLQKSDNSKDKRLPVIDIVRCLDHSFVYSHYVLPKKLKSQKDLEILDLIGTGFYEALSLFYDSSIQRSGYPLFESSENSIAWTNKIMINSGHIGYAKRIIKLTEQGIFKVSKLGNEYTFKNQTLHPGREALGAEDFYWWQKQLRPSAKENERLKELKPIVEKQLFDHVEIWRGFFIKYGCTKELDEFYEIAGKQSRITMHSSDSFSESSRFGDFDYREIVCIMESLVGYTIKHKDHCLALLKKTNYKINPWNIYSLPYRLDDLSNAIAIHKNLPKDLVYNFLNQITLNDENISILGKDAGSSTPPLIKISKEIVLRSVAGSLNNPFSYLTRALKLNYEKDYFKAVNDREKLFKQELYSLFPSDKIHKSTSNINLKQNGNLITDIDALLYDEITETLIIIQLKWSDDFGPSMQMRNSMANNFMQKSIKWIDNTLEWLNVNEHNSLLTRLYNFNNANNSQISNLYLWVIGRNFSHFSDKVEDVRAIWFSWYRLLRLLHENSDLKDNLHKLSTTLKSESIQRQEIPQIQKQSFKVGKFKLSPII